jgi:iron complex transport system substrate-binding protein
MKLFAPVTAVLALALALAGCANPDNAEQPEAAPVSSGSTFPATVPTKFGDVTVESAPTRVVALGWGDAETALALGVQPVGASDWLQFGGEGVGPWATGRYDTPPEIIGTLEPSYEAIAALDPDLILDTKSSGDQKRYDRLSAIATTVGVPEGGDSYLTTAEQQLTMVATALGRTAEATTLQEGLEKSFADARAAHPDWAGKTVTAATKTSEGWGAYIEGSERVQFLQDLGFVQNPKIAELDSSATGFSVNISTEQLELVDADLVVAFPIFIDSSELTGDRFFKRVPAVAEGRSLVIDGDLASAYSLGTVLAQQYALENLVPRIAETLGS